MNKLTLDSKKEPKVKKNLCYLCGRGTQLTDSIDDLKVKPTENPIMREIVREPVKTKPFLKDKKPQNH